MGKTRPSSNASTHLETRKKKRKGPTSSLNNGHDQLQAAMPYEEAPPSLKRCKVRGSSGGYGGRDAEEGIDGHEEAHHSHKRRKARVTGASSPNGDKAAGDEEPLRAEAVTILSRLTLREDNQRTDVVHGTFSNEEKQILREATVKYAHNHGQSDVNFDWLYKKTKRDPGAFAAIAKALPHRKQHSVYMVVTRMYHPGNYKGKFTVEEREKLRGLVPLYIGHNQKWRVIGELLGRTPNYCRTLWRQVCLGDEKAKGKWSSEEENRLRLLVREQIAARKESEAAEMKLRLEQMSKVEGAAAVCLTPSDGREFRDRVDFAPIADKMGNRVYDQCKRKWYAKLSPSMFSSGEWALGDDITMVTALLSAGCEWVWEVEWDRLVPNRTAEQLQRLRFLDVVRVLRQMVRNTLSDPVVINRDVKFTFDFYSAPGKVKRRWKSMLRGLPDYLEKRFDVCVEELAEKYSSHRCRQLLENLK